MMDVYQTDVVDRGEKEIANIHYPRYLQIHPLHRKRVHINAFTGLFSLISRYVVIESAEVDR